MNHELQLLCSNMQAMAKNHWDILTEEQQNQIELFGQSMQFRIINGFEARALQEIKQATEYLNNILFNL